MTRTTLWLAVAAMPLISAASAQAQDDGFGTLLLDVRARHETVEQTGKLDASATTVRTRLGWRSPDWHGVTLLGELENVFAAGSDDGFNSGLNGQTQYASISDGSFTELNRLQAGFSPTEGVSVTVGRQYLGFDDGRFVASAGHRQDKNSHDALAVSYERGAFDLDYVYHARINRGPGEDFDWDSDSHLFHLGYDVSEASTLAGFLYLIDITEPGREERSNMTWGGRYTGARNWQDWSVEYALMYAHQSDYGSATTDFDLDYIASEIEFGHNGLALNVGYDRIEGDGSTSFSNPLGSNHGFLGWADAFSGGGRQGTVDGLEDLHAMLSFSRDINTGPFNRLSGGVRRHEFDADRTGADLGGEWDVFVTARFEHGVSLSWQFADYDGPDVAPAPADRTKGWVVLSYAH